MNIRNFLFFCCFILFTIESPQICFSQQAKTRDLSRYEQGGTYDFGWGHGWAKLQEMRPKLRKFLWTHWSERRLATVAAVFYTIEGDPTKRTFYIEPDKSGKWQVVSEFESECCALFNLEKPKRKRKRVTGKEIYDQVERVETGKPSERNTIVIPESQIPEPDAFLLRLKRAVSKPGESEAVLIL